ncbi:MAG: sodium-dependent transporter [Proteobacteria bacterium]|nr:sodium-dependent transporter [Pseudomonadota bacterium]MBU4472321.1 sodium-dependent transporter [Pseudomonadota bacterium]MCG2752017.1 sodium-dependent transporter [Desulfobacteraceae bacterium]
MQREQWNSQIGFLLAAVGSAIGLGNIWRFSYVAYSNGGGAFLIPYITALLTAGISMLILEFGLGHEKMGSAPLAFSRVRKGWEWLGWWSVTFVMFGIELYYTVIIAWCLSFFFFSFNLAWGSDPNNFFFNEYLKVSSGPGEIGSIRWPILISTVVVWLLNWTIVCRGLKKGIERANKIFMPFLFILMGTLVFWSLSLEGAMNGIRAYLTPDFSVLTSPKVWVDAYSQIFFDLSLGFGIMIAYSSYLPEKANLSRNAMLTGTINCSFSLMSGFAVFSVLGFMATSQGKPITEVVSQSIGLAFVAYPKAVSLIPGGKIFGAIFFLSLVLAGLSSSISIIEAFSSSMVDKFNIPKKKLVTVLCGMGLLGSVIFTCQGGLYWLDITDHFLSHYGLVVVGILECLLLGWVFDIKKLREHINGISSIQLGLWWDRLIKYFIPVILSVIFISDVYREIKSPYEGYSWTSLICIGFGWIVVTLATAVIISLKPWRRGIGD